VTGRRDYKPYVRRSDELDEEILSRLEQGETVTQICRGGNMPTLRAVQKWRREDPVYEGAIHDAWVRGLQCRFDRNYDDQQVLVNNPAEFDPKVANALATITRDRSHQIMAAQTRLDCRWKNQTTVEHTGPMMIGWDDKPEPGFPGGTVAITRGAEPFLTLEVESDGTNL
jgi:hypothetical protein